MASKLLKLLLLIALLTACVPAAPGTPSAAPEPTAMPERTATLEPTAAVRLEPTPSEAPTEVLPTPPWAQAPLSGPALVDGLRQGGFVIFFRHATSDRAQRDTEQDDLSDCTLQRNLNDVGVAEARAIGEAFTALAIPVGQVLSSGFCRCWQTANGAFGRYEITEDLKSVTTETLDARVAALRRLLATPPEPGTNTILVSHGNNISNAAGVPLTEGEAAVFRPVAGGYELVAQVTAEGWTALADEVAVEP